MTPTESAYLETMRGWLPELAAAPGPRRVRLQCRCGHSWLDTVPAVGTVTPCPACERKTYTNRAEVAA